MSEKMLVQLQGALQRQGHTVEVSTFGLGSPLSFRINGGPELTERQFMQETGRMLGGMAPPPRTTRKQRPNTRPNTS